GRGAAGGAGGRSDRGDLAVATGRGQPEGGGGGQSEGGGAVRPGDGGRPGVHDRGERGRPAPGKAVVRLAQQAPGRVAHVLRPAGRLTGGGDRPGVAAVAGAGDVRSRRAEWTDRPARDRPGSAQQGARP